MFVVPHVNLSAKGLGAAGFDAIFGADGQNRTLPWFCGTGNVHVVACSAFMLLTVLRPRSGVRLRGILPWTSLRLWLCLFRTG